MVHPIENKSINQGQLKRDAPQEMHPKLFYRSFNFLICMTDYFT